MRWLLAAILAGVAAASCPSNSSARQDCAFPGVTQAECEARACCWDSSLPSIWCALPACGTDPARCVHGTCQNEMCVCTDNWTGPLCDTTPITTVHVVQSCHLDVGFANTAPNIVNLWFDHHFPYAIEVAAQLKAQNNNVSLKFMAQSYLVSLFLDCPSGMGLNCPNATQVSAFKQAVADGVIWWHAFPHNAELETMAPVLIQEGVALSHSLQSQLGAQLSTTLSQRDVPGMTRSVIPVLKKSGVNYINVGVNGGSTPPQVPKIFKWQDNVSGESVVAMWHPYGYGGFDVNSAITVPGCSHALVTDWNGDNAGPYSASDYVNHFAAIQKEFPNAQIIASTWDDFTQYLPSVEANLPVVTSELGDTWMYGVPSDPLKVAYMKVMNRAWTDYLLNGGVRDPVYLNATRLAVKAGEHTWGSDVKMHLSDNSDWSNADFNAARANPSLSGQYSVLEASWWQQRAWSYGFALQALTDANHPLGAALTQGFAEIAGAAPTPAKLAQYTQVSNLGELFDCGGYTIGFDPATGALTTFVDKASGAAWASPSSPLLLLQYQTYNNTDVQTFISDYVVIQASWAQHDFGKPNVTVGKPVHTTYAASLQALYVQKSAARTSFLLQSTMDSYAHTMAGGAQSFWIQVDVPVTPSAPVNISLSVLNKTTTRLPEAMFVTFNPPVASTLLVDKLNEYVNASDVVPGGAQKLHFVDSGFMLRAPSGASLKVGMVDAGVVCAGEPTGYPLPLNSPPDVATHGASALLWENLWGTNYIMWYPFSPASSATPVSADPDLLYRFTLTVQ